MTTERNKKKTIGLVGVVLGFMALGMALFHFYAGPIGPQPAVEEVVADQAIKIKDRVIAKLKGDKTKVMAPKRTYSKDQIFDIATVSTAFLAIVLAVISFIMREDKRACGSAAVLGLGAIVFQFATIALGVIVLAILVAGALAVLGSFGFS